MQCERLIKMIKSWYLHVRDETMAPARMVGFIEEHAETCDICLNDAGLKEEIAKITELILPESKIPKAVRQQNLKNKEAEEEVDENEGEEITDDGDEDEEEEEVLGDEEDEIEANLEIDDSNS